MAKKRTANPPAQAADAGIHIGPLTVECPVCKAAPGQQCKGFKGRVIAPHARRGATRRKPAKLVQRDLFATDL